MEQFSYQHNDVICLKTINGPSRNKFIVLSCPKNDIGYRIYIHFDVYLYYSLSWVPGSSSYSQFRLDLIPSTSFSQQPPVWLGQRSGNVVGLSRRHSDKVIYRCEFRI